MTTHTVLVHLNLTINTEFGYSPIEDEQEAEQVATQWLNAIGVNPDDVALVEVIS